ncbi:MAG: ferritin family protein [Betaproteobacteria bacterium]|nr:ferritin family protein [Betaproteobacteria bacterium]
MNPARPIRSSEELLAHAIEIEREAAARYSELGERMRDLGNDVVAELFLRLADLEQKHEHELELRARGLDLPRIAPGEYAWLEDHAPETAAHSLVLNLLTPHSALKVALDAEKRALEFFETAREQSADPKFAALATELAAEEGVHIAWVQSAIRRTPDPVIDWAAIFG